jgi:uncharacterized membrane protein YccC
VIDVLIALPREILAELRELTLRGPRGGLAVTTALAVGAAILAALSLRLEDAYWAGISAFVCSQASQPASLQKGLHRIVGTTAGAVAALIAFPPLAFDHAATMLLLFCAGSSAIAGSLVSRYSYAWLLGGITAVMVMLGALDDPRLALHVAFFRCAEVAVGVLAALLMSKLLLPSAPTVLPPVASEWGSLFDSRRVVLAHALKTGLAIALVPPIWRIFELPNLSQMAISIGAVMAVPVLTASHEQNRRAVLDRSVQRIAGCLVGGGIGLLALTFPSFASFPLWLLTLMAGAAIAVQMEAGRHNAKTFAIQAEVALILTMVQGWAPAVSLLPAIDRLFGMLGAVLLLFAVTLILGSPRDTARVIPS